LIPDKRLECVLVAACTSDICYPLKKWFIFYDDKLIGYEEIPELSLSLHM
jgi:hypothetical protein